MMLYDLFASFSFKYKRRQDNPFDTRRIPSASLQRFQQHLHRMFCLSSRTMFNMLPATGSRCGNDGFCRHFSYLREKRQFANLHRQFVMIFLISKRTCHTTTSCFQFIYGIIYRYRQHIAGGLRGRQRFLMTMTVEGYNLPILCRKDTKTGGIYQTF